MPPKHLQPPPICFCFSIKSITPNFEVEQPRYTPPNASLWVPPANYEAFDVFDDTGWYFWRGGEILRVPQAQQGQVQLHRITSMFWCPDRQAFQQVPFDCTEVSVGEAPDGVLNGMPLDWDKLTFHARRLTTNTCISILGYHYEKNTLEALRTPSWVPSLLPEVYRHSPPSHQAGHNLLAGDLSIILGLTAFSTTRDNMLATIGNSFRMAEAGTRWTSQGPSRVGSKQDHVSGY